MGRSFPAPGNDFLLSRLKSYKEKPFLLTVTLSIRNIDPQHPLRITAVGYYETRGRLLKKYMDAPVILNPLESVRYIVPEKDEAGGSGANFIVEWQSEKKSTRPLLKR